MAANDKIFTIKIDGSDTAITNLNQLRGIIGATERELKKADFGSAKFAELSARSAQLKAKQAELSGSFAATQATAQKMGSSVGAAIGQLGQLGGPIGQATGMLESLAGAGGQAGGALKGLAGAGPVAAVFGLIMVALAPLLAAFGRMPGLVDKITAAWEGAMAVAKVFAATLADLGEAALAALAGDFDTAGKKVDDFTNKLSNMTTVATEAFEKAFDLTEQRLQLERLGAEVQRTTKILETQKSVIESQMADESAMITDRIELAKKRGQIEQQIADKLAGQAQKELALFEKTLKADQYKTKILANGAIDRQQASEDEIKKWDELTVKVAEANSRQAKATIDTANQVVAYKKLQGEKLLELARIQNDKEKIQLEQTLQIMKRNRDTDAESQIELINKLLANRLNILNQEQKAIIDNNSKNGKLNEEWSAKYADLEKIKLEATLQAENQKQEAVKTSMQLQAQRAVAQKDFEIKSAAQTAENNKLDMETQKQLLALTEREAQVKLQIAQKTGSLVDLWAAEVSANEAIVQQQALQTAELQQQYEAATQQLELERQKLQVELTLLESSKNITEADQNRIAMIKQELALLQQKQQGLTLKLNVDTKGVEQQTKTAVQASATQFDQLQKQMIQTQVQNTVTLVTQALAGVQVLFEALDEAQKAQIDKQLEAIDAQKTAIEERISATEAALSETFTNIDALEAKAAEARGARRDAAIGLIETEMKRSAKLQQQKKQEQAEQAKLAAQAKELDNQKAAMEQEAAKRSMILSAVQQAANIAIAITQAAATPWPANIAAIASTIGAVVAALATVSSIVMKFEKGGQLPQRAIGGLLTGPSHARGGILAMAAGGPIAEVEGGEFVVNRKATSQFLPVLQKINSFAEGGVLAPNSELQNILPSQSGSLGNNDKIYEQLVALTNLNAQIAANPPIVSVVEVQRALDNITRLQEAPKI